ncbi:hypothetical protein DRO97_00600 [Archaeoglobales archaeon]|nr:MAG: hypothetical protein DRO97_00600 [Archaeoglobales archaeon]
MPLELAAIKIAQVGWRSKERKDITLYLTKMTARQLIDESIVKVDKWDQKNNPSGYQRPLSRYRRREIFNYLTKEEGIFPTSILLNVRGEVKFEQSNESIGKLIIPDESLPMFLVDGQHRVAGLQFGLMKDYTEFLDFPLPVVIMNQNKETEIAMFYKINKRQKGVPVDIAERNIREMIKTQKEVVLAIEGERKVLEAEAVEIVDYLNTEPDSPWYEKVYVPGGPRKGTLIKQSVMAKAIGKMYERNTSLLVEDPENIKTFLKDYWRAVKDLYPTAFGNNTEYNLTRSQGVRSLTYLAGNIYIKCKEQNNFTFENIRSILEKLKVEPHPIDDVWWHREYGAEIIHGTNERAVERLYHELLEKIIT